MAQIIKGTVLLLLCSALMAFAEDRPCVSLDSAREALRLGRAQRYTDEEILQAYANDPCETLKFLSAHNETGKTAVAPPRDNDATQSGESVTQPPSLYSDAERKASRLVSIRVLGNSEWDKTRSGTLMGTPSTSNTDCTDIGGNINCTTTTIPGVPRRTITHVMHEVEVHVEMPDGSHATLWCQQQYRYCTALAPGKYEAEIKGDIAFVHVNSFSEPPKYDSNGKLQPRETHTDRVKYHIVAAN